MARFRGARFGMVVPLFVLVAAHPLSTPAVAAPHAVRAPRGTWVTVSPPLVRKAPKVREYLTADERTVVARISDRINALPRPAAGPSAAAIGARWFVEPAAESSQVLALQRRVLLALQSVADAAGGLPEGWTMTFVAGRTQDYLKSVLSQEGCSPGLARTSGVVLLGASVCGRHVMVSNLTGYLHLTSAGQSITAAMEAAPEAALRTMPHRLVVRASGGLAHEFVHSWRAAPLSGETRADEPAWFAEGLAEFWAGVAVTRALGLRNGYLTQHVLRSRDFADWAPRCAQPLSAYRAPTALGAGCEYHVGLLAVERLHAMQPDLLTPAAALATAGSFPTFAEWFARSYGISLDEFERQTDSYIAVIRRAEARG